MMNTMIRTAVLLIALAVTVVYGWSYHTPTEVDSKLSEPLQQFAYTVEGCMNDASVAVLDSFASEKMSVQLVLLKTQERAIVVYVPDTQDLYRQVSEAQCSASMSLIDSSFCTTPLFLDLFKDALPVVSRMLRKSHTNEVSFVGKHVGGSVATLLSIFFSMSSLLYVDRLVTFGSPPAGNLTMYEFLSSYTTYYTLETQDDYYPWIVRDPLMYSSFNRRIVDEKMYTEFIDADYVRLKENVIRQSRSYNDSMMFEQTLKACYAPCST